MKKLVVIFAIAVAGCSTVVPVKRTFPDAPAELQKQCQDLKTLEGNKVSIMDLMKTVVENYKLYYECSNKVEGWQDWYKTQKDIFDSVK